MMVPSGRTVLFSCHATIVLLFLLENRRESQGEKFPCAQSRRLWKLCVPCWPHQGRECHSLPPQMLWSCFCAALFDSLKLSSPFERSCLKKKYQFDLKSFLKRGSSGLSASSQPAWLFPRAQTLPGFYLWHCLALWV